ncbi:MAG: 16S rRNA (guanine(966)-N(2))-methyltransferase RsmD [Succiniclasticum sp.]|nr:16S rRNA (guanine(966)-N(2))-methyltransferase RsmD [Succiniclasticum sp.]
MRIITGKARGLRLNVPKNYDVRPTADRVKESLFNILGNKVNGAQVLDLFAGSGNLGLEAWSRGAAGIQFVDNNRASLRLVESNITKCRAEAECTVLQCDAPTAIARLYKKGRRFDLIFADPPYNKELLQKVLANLAEYPVLAEGGRLIMEHSAHDEAETALPPEYVIFRRQKYGETCLSFVCYSADTKESAVREENTVMED